MGSSRWALKGFLHGTSLTLNNLNLVLKNTAIFMNSSLELHALESSEHSLSHSFFYLLHQLFWRWSHTFLDLSGTASQPVALWSWTVVSHHLHQSVNHELLPLRIYMHFLAQLCRLSLFPDLSTRFMNVSGTWSNLILTGILLVALVSMWTLYPMIIWLLP